MNSGEKIRERRLALKLTQKELGERLNVSQQMIGQWENNVDNIKLSTLGKIADALDLHVLDLLTDAQAHEYYSRVDESVIEYYASIGYNIDFQNDELIIEHNGYGYKMDTLEFDNIEFSLERKAEQIIKELLSEHEDTRYEVN